MIYRKRRVPLLGLVLLHVERWGIGIESWFFPLSSLIILLFQNRIEFHIVEQTDFPFSSLLISSADLALHSKAGVTEASLRLELRLDWYCGGQGGLFLVIGAWFGLLGRRSSQFHDLYKRETIKKYRVASTSWTLIAITFMPSSPSLFKSLTALWANSVRSYSTKAQTLSVISGCLLAKGFTSAGIGFPGRKILTRTISPQTLKSSATASIVGLSVRKRSR